jgi:membrane protease YdiL (CAAX protease family)
MLSDRPWKLESVLMVAAGLLASMSLGLLGGLALAKFGARLDVADKSFYASMIGNLTMQGAALVLAHRFLRQHAITWRQFLGLHRPDVPAILLRAVLVALLAVPMAHVLKALADTIFTALRSEPPDLQPAIQTLHISQTLGRRILLSFFAMVLAPVAEEVIFRGILYAAVKELGHPRLALFGTSIVFAAIHQSWVAFVPLTFFALVLTLLYERTQSLLAPIVAHAGFNAVNLLGFFLFRHVLERGS